MKNKIINNSGEKSYENEDTHLTDDSQVPKESENPTRLLTPTRSTNEAGNVTLTKAERAVLSTQYLIDWGYFIRCHVANEFAPVIRHNNKNNKLGKQFALLQWSIEINKSNLLIHQSASNNFCSQIASPAKSKNDRS